LISGKATREAATKAHAREQEVSECVRRAIKSARREGDTPARSRHLAADPQAFHVGRRRGGRGPGAGARQVRWLVFDTRRGFVGVDFNDGHLACAAIRPDGNTLGIRTFDAVRDGTWVEKPKKKTAFFKRKALGTTTGTSGIDGAGPVPGGDGPTPPEGESDGTGLVPATHPSTKWETGPALAA